MNSGSNDSGAPEGADFEVDFGDPAPTPVPAKTRKRAQSSEPVHPADEEWRPPDPPHREVSHRNSVAIGRSLPNSPEAEEYLLSCCLLDGRDMVRRCEEAKVGPDTFYDNKHGIIYECIYKCYVREIEIDISTVAEELKTAKLLDQVGGYSFLTQISSRIPTTAQAGYFISKVKEQSVLRDIIRSATAIVEDAHNFTGGIEEFLDEQMTRLRKVVEHGSPIASDPLIPMTEFKIPQSDDATVLLGHRYLSRGDGAILAGTSGIGKSSIEVQMATLWALGLPAFGIPPNGPLKSVIFQAEDSAGDMGEMFASVAHELKLTKKQIEQVKKNVLVRSERVLRGTKFVTAMRRYCDKHKPDIVWINPLQAFMDGDVTNGQDLGKFLRENLNGSNPEKFAYIIVHHTTKPSTGKDRGDRQWHEVMYDMAGGAEIINWARAILSLRATAAEGEFNLVLAKRGRRAGVTKEVEQGAGTRMEPVTIIPLKHAKGKMKLEDGRDMPIIFWEARTTPDAEAEKSSGHGRPEKYSFADYRNIFPAKSSPGLELNQLHKVLSANKEIQKKTLHNVLRRWAEDSLIEIVEAAGQPMRYRKIV
jgi:hypothetical protein